MVWETLPVILNDAGTHRPGLAVWPFIPFWSEGRVPVLTPGTEYFRDEISEPPWMGIWRVPGVSTRCSAPPDKKGM